MIYVLCKTIPLRKVKVKVKVVPPPSSSSDIQLLTSPSSPEGIVFTVFSRLKSTNTYRQEMQFKVTSMQTLRATQTKGDNSAATDQEGGCNNNHPVNFLPKEEWSIDYEDCCATSPALHQWLSWKTLTPRQPLTKKSLLHLFLP